jgi:hypothetical protein
MKDFFIRNRWLIISICGVAVIVVVIAVLLTTSGPPPQPTVSPTTTPTTTITTTTPPPTSPATTPTMPPPLKFTHPVIGVALVHATPGATSGCPACHSEPISFSSCLDCHEEPNTVIASSVNFPHHSLSWGSSREYCQGCHTGTDADARFVEVPADEHPFCDACHELKH